MTLGQPNQPSSAMSGEAVQPSQRTWRLIRIAATCMWLMGTPTHGFTNLRPMGRHLFSWGESGTGEGQFNIVHNITTDKEGWVYIADRENHRVQVFSPDGKYETQWLNLSRAACICLDTSDEPLVYVGEYFGGIASNKMGTELGPRVSIMDTKGNVLAQLSDQSYGDEPGRFYSPHGIAVDSKGNIYVAEVSWSRLWEPDGSAQRTSFTSRNWSSGVKQWGGIRRSLLQEN